MSSPPPKPSHDAAFAVLERALAARRRAALDARSRVVIGAIVLLGGAFTFWQTRIPLDGDHRANGASHAAGMLAIELGAFALAAGVIAYTRQLALAARPPGPEWLALPLPPARVARHLLGEARLFGAIAFPAALAALVAGIGLVPPVWLGLFAVAFVVAWLETTRLGAALARRRAAAPVGPGRRLDAATRVLVRGAQERRVRPLPPARWLAERPWRALARLDLLISSRASRSRDRLLLAALFALLATLAWTTNAPPILRRAQSFAAYSLMAATLGAWALSRAASDPPSATRPLPLTLADAWRARVLPVLASLAVVASVEVLAAVSLPPGARVALLFTWWPAAAAVAVLGVHYGLTLTGRPAVAENLYIGWLGVALVASIMIPFLGWGVLIAGLVHSSMRLSNWWRPEVG